jgi:filamentous hemagglutinin
LDKYGQEWQKGTSKTAGQHFEWDVQKPEGGHINVDWDGNISDGQQP